MEPTGCIYPSRLATTFGMYHHSAAYEATYLGECISLDTVVFIKLTIKIDITDDEIIALLRAGYGLS